MSDAKSPKNKKDMPRHETAASARDAAAQRIRESRENSPDTQAWARAIQSGQREALGRSITLAESALEQDKDRLKELLENLPAQAPELSLRIGITGVPGVGKSTFIEGFGQALIQQGHRVAVLAIDPSSQRSGGSILGDKTRMETLSRDPNAYVRPSPAADALGGVSSASYEAVRLCEAAGYDRIIIETVGVGQSETAVKQICDLFLLLMLPGAGDELQGIKRGIMEMADIMVINKSDGDGVKTAHSAANAYRQALHLFPKTEAGHQVEVLTASALEQTGIDEVINHANALHKQWLNTGWMDLLRQRQTVAHFRRHIRRSLMQRAAAIPGHVELMERLQNQVEQGQISPFNASRTWLDALVSKP